MPPLPPLLSSISQAGWGRPPTSNPILGEQGEPPSWAQKRGRDRVQREGLSTRPAFAPDPWGHGCLGETDRSGGEGTSRGGERALRRGMQHQQREGGRQSCSGLSRGQQDPGAQASLVPKAPAALDHEGRCPAGPSAVLGCALLLPRPGGVSVGTHWAQVASRSQGGHSQKPKKLASVGLPANLESTEFQGWKGPQRPSSRTLCSRRGPAQSLGVSIIALFPLLPPVTCAGVLLLGSAACPCAGCGPARAAPGSRWPGAAVEGAPSSAGGCWPRPCRSGGR